MADCLIWLYFEMEQTVCGDLSTLCIQVWPSGVSGVGQSLTYISDQTVVGKTADMETMFSWRSESEKRKERGKE